MDFTPAEARVLGCLIEKEATVPDSYPLTLNALRLACNQTSNREPVMAYDNRTVDGALVALKFKGLVRFVHASHGARTTRYRHLADERWNLDRPNLAVLSVLLLRGPQTVGEIRSRTDRHYAFETLNEVEEVLDALKARSPEPFVTRLEHVGPGWRDPRWGHLLCGEPELPEIDADEHPPEADLPTESESFSPDRLAAIEAEVAELRRRLDALEKDLGVE